jgi:hypothetical protein
MVRIVCWLALVVGCLGVGSGLASAQSFEVLGSRPAGMGGAFVAVADDVSGVYWNPAGLALGAYFSLLVDYSSAEATPDGTVRAGSRSGSIIALAAPMIGLSYYRLRATTLSEARDAGATPTDVRLQSLITHHAGATLVQSLTDWMAVGATLKLVRGVAATAVVSGGDRDELLDEASDLVGAASNSFDADIGVIATAGNLRAGLTVRNVTEPEFDGPGGALRLQRQIRAGVAVTAVPGLLVAADFDVERVAGTVGEERNVAIGAEARIHPRAFVRSGVRINTLGDEPTGHRPVVSFGGSYAVYGSLFVDGQATVGSEAGDRGWGVAARAVF